MNLTLIILIITIILCIIFCVFEVRNWNKRCAAARERFLAGERDKNAARDLHTREK
ncbi:MAG: hypothetical protein IJH47_06525 [Oscillospiraceae bacterium]|nr:hypothetical protein [Oscillospiraceae bacterium]